MTPHFTLEELVLSTEAARKGIKNIPNEAQKNALLHLCTKVLEPLRIAVNKPIIVYSGFRSPEVNRLVGGSYSSQHCKGEAVDIKIPGMTVAEVVATIRKMNLPFDQLIDEFGQWIHVSHARSGKQRGQVLAARRIKGVTKYKSI